MRAFLDHGRPVDGAELRLDRPADLREVDALDLDLTALKMSSPTCSKPAFATSNFAVAPFASVSFTTNPASPLAAFVSDGAISDTPSPARSLNRSRRMLNAPGSVFPAAARPPQTASTGP